MIRNLGNVPQSIPILFPQSSSTGAASSSTTPQNMAVDRTEGVKRDNEDDSSKPKKTQRKSEGPSLIKKAQARIATSIEQSKAIPKSLDTPKIVKVSKEVFKDIFNSVKKSITNPATEAKPLPPIRKRIVKKSVDPRFTEKENALIALTDAEKSIGDPKTLSTKEEKQLNVMRNVIINSIKNRKKRKNC